MYSMLYTEIYEKVKSVPDQKRQEVTSTTTTPQQEAKNPRQQPINKPQVNKPNEQPKKPVAEQNIKLDDKKSKNAKNFLSKFEIFFQHVDEFRSNMKHTTTTHNKK